MTLLGHRKNPFKQGHPELIMVLVWVTVTCDQAFSFPSPPKQKGKKGRLIAGYAPINLNPVGGGGGRVRARGGDLTKESISSVGGLIEYLCSGVGTFDLFGRETGAKTKRGYLASSFLSLEWRGFRRR